MSSQASSAEEIEKLKAEVAALTEENSRIHKERIEYLQNVSHQLVAPLNAMKWHIENLTNARIGVERAKKVLRSIYSQATIAVHLAKNFALMSNLEEDHELGSLKEPLQQVDLCRLLINIADDFQPFGWERSIQIKVDDKEFGLSPPVLAMKPLISQVFSNIIENAIKYSNDDTMVQVGGMYDKAKDSVVVEIANRGIGIDASESEQVFERAYRSERAKSRYPAGTGFGLYIAKKIVSIHKGSIEAFTDQSGYTVLSVALPVRALEGKARTVDRPLVPAKRQK